MPDEAPVTIAILPSRLAMQDSFINDDHHHCVDYMTVVMYNVKQEKRQERRMKVTREQAIQNRERIVEAAAQLFRERGFDGIGVADLMKQAGLTHGGFYGHFSSKEDLIREASARALTNTFALLSEQAERAAGDPLAAVEIGRASCRERVEISVVAGS